jgi:hypothetical protein
MVPIIHVFNRFLALGDVWALSNPELTNVSMANAGRIKKQFNFIVAGFKL